MSNYKISQTSLIALGIYLLLNFFFFSKTWRIASPSEVIAFSPNSKMIAVASGEQIRKQINPNAGMKDYRQNTSKVEISKVRSGRIIQSFDFFAASRIAFSPDNSLIAVGGYGGEIKIWRINDQKLLYSFRDGEHYFFETLLLSFLSDKLLIFSICSKTCSILVAGSRQDELWQTRAIAPSGNSVTTR